MTEETGNLEPAKEIRWIAPPEGVTEVYSNFVHLNWTLYDVRIRLGQVLPNQQPSEETTFWQISEDTAVTIPWGQAKILRDMLIDAIQRYENTNGELKMPTLPK